MSDMINKKIYYDIYGEFYNVNKYRELKSIIHHGNNRLDHINRVAKLSFLVSKRMGLDYISCTRGAMMHDFFTIDDISKRNKKYNDFLKEHPKIALDNSEKYFEVNEVEKDIILSHMYPIVREKPLYKESKIVCMCDKIISIYEFFRYQVNLSMNVTLVLFINLMK